MSTYFFAPVYGPKDQLLRYVGVTVETTPPEMRRRLAPHNAKDEDFPPFQVRYEKGLRLAPLATGRNAAFAAIKQTLATGERVAKHDLRSIW